MEDKKAYANTALSIAATTMLFIVFIAAVLFALKNNANGNHDAAYYSMKAELELENQL